MEYGVRGDIFYGGIQDTTVTERLLLFSPIILVLFTAMRLAEFNIREESAEFSGLPSPAAAILVAGGNICLVRNLGALEGSFILEPLVLLALILIISFLMVARIPMFSLKFMNYNWKGNQIRYLFLTVSGILLIILQEIALPVIILFYLLLSITVSLIRKPRQ
jgi:CDP-diacylglycerol--serine O-phosphatidyltransferase